MNYTNIPFSWYTNFDLEHCRSCCASQKPHSNNRPMILILVSIIIGGCDILSFFALAQKKKLLTKLATRVEASGATEWILCRKECYVSVGWSGILSTDWSCLERVRTDIFSRSLILYSSLRDGPRFIVFHHNVRVENSVAIQNRDYPALLRILSLMVHGNIPSFLSFSSRTK